MGNMAHVAHVGDSRAYLISKKEVEQLTRDHSLVQRLIELGTITYEESLDHPQRNVLYRAIGQAPDLEVDTMTRRLPAGATILICSDGLWGCVSSAEMLEIVSNTADPQEACDKLVALANAHGGHDNITVVLFRMPGNQG
jgi:protein phosphatase